MLSLVECLTVPVKQRETMANLNADPKYEAGIYQIERTNPVVGGADGISNRPAHQLANRTAWFK